MQSISMSASDVTTLASAYPDRAEWARIGFDGENLLVPDDLAAKVAAIDLSGAKKSSIIAYASTKRYAVEVGGITVNGVPIATDDRSKLMIAGARTAADADNTFTTQWVGSDGNVYPLTAAQIIAISNAVLAHVSACFATWATLQASIGAGTVTTTAQVDSAFTGIV